MTRKAKPQAAGGQARLIVDGHTRGFVCAGLVWTQFIELATADTFPLFMAELTPELQSYFRDVILPSEPQGEEEREALGWLAEYYANEK